MYMKYVPYTLLGSDAQFVHKREITLYYLKDSEQKNFKPDNHKIKPASIETVFKKYSNPASFVEWDCILSLHWQ